MNEKTSAKCKSSTESQRQYQPIVAQIILGCMGKQFYSIFSQGGIIMYFIFFLPEPLGKFQTNLAQNNIWVKGVQVCLNEGSHPFLRRDKDKIG